jgi:hypothetical protein
MNVTIFTDESGVKLPEIKKWKKSLGRGKNIDNDKEIISLLEENSLPLPDNNIDLEEKYLEILHEHIRPARTMFAGMFTEVREFKDCLSNYADTSLYIISGRYGLLRDDEIIIPYVSKISNPKDIEALEKRTNFSQRMIEKAIDSDVILICLPTYFISYLLTINWFSRLDPNSLVVLVSSKHFKEIFSDMQNVKLLERKGVARIGSPNKEEIILFLDTLSRNNINF